MPGFLPKYDHATHTISGHDSPVDPDAQTVPDPVEAELESEFRALEARAAERDRRVVRAAMQRERGEVVRVQAQPEERLDHVFDATDTLDQVLYLYRRQCEQEGAHIGPVRSSTPDGLPHCGLCGGVIW